MADKKITELTDYTPPIDTDVLPVVDITTTVTKKVTWANIKATLKTYFDTLYNTIISKASGSELDTGTDDAKYATSKAIKDAHNVPSVAPSTSGNLMTSNGTDWVSTTAPTQMISTTKYAPQGFLLNGKIVPSVASNNLTVAIKGMDGNDPSASNPVYVRIGDTVRTITAALSVTKNSGTNWFDAGSTEMATYEIDYFVYLGYNATDGVVIGFARIPFANEYGDFSTTNTDQKYCAISTITNAAAGDDYELIGRFAATLSAGAGYTWTVPTFTNKNLIQRPIFETRKLYWDPNLSGFSTEPTWGSAVWYQLQMNRLLVSMQLVGDPQEGVSNATTCGFVIPFKNPDSASHGLPCVAIEDNAVWSTTGGRITVAASTSAVSVYTNTFIGAWTNSGAKRFRCEFMILI